MALDVYNIDDPLHLTTEYSEVWDNYPDAVIQHNVTRSTQIIDGLADNPAVRGKFIFLYREAFRRGLLCLFYSGYRDFVEQLALYEAYKAGGPRAAAPGYSFHNYGRAIDAMVLDYKGTGNLPNGLNQLQQVNVDFALGLRWGGTFGDYGHFAYVEESLKELQENSPQFKAWVLAHPQEQKEVQQSQEYRESIKPTFWQKNGHWIGPTAIGITVGIILFIFYKFTKNNN